MIWSFSYFFDSALSSVFWFSYWNNDVFRVLEVSRSTYCFRFLLDFLYWSLASICSAVRPRRNHLFLPWSFELMTCMLGGWILNYRLCLCPWTPLLVLNSLVSWARVVVASPSPSLLPTAGGYVSVSGVIINPRVFRYWTRQWWKPIKYHFIVRLFRNNEHPFPGWSFFYCSHTLHDLSFLILLHYLGSEHPICIYIGWTWQRLYLRRHNTSHIGWMPYNEWLHKFALS